MDATMTRAQQMVKTAPQSIRGDMEVVLAAYAKYSDALAAAQYEPSKVSSEVTAFMTTTELQAARDRITAYEQANCELPAPEIHR